MVGSGPAGLTAAWQLARKGYHVKIFEAAPEPGGMLRLAIPGYRLPVSVVERDIENVTALGVEIATSTRVENLEELRREGYDAILVATGAPVSTSLGVPGEDLRRRRLRPGVPRGGQARRGSRACGEAGRHRGRRERGDGCRADRPAAGARPTERSW